ncbi:hypothetical protein [Streptomyces sp. NPDC037389]|uniref:hypothetical protein n=1 Tax=Streptomyces sp. NPDC037389 TaxID=3155369 RepID=UPI0033FF54E3
MVKKHGKKSRARQRARRTGAPHQAAATRTTHEHTPLPDMTVLGNLPYSAGRAPDTELAARLVAACRAGCRPCQDSLARKASADRPTLAALAGAVYGLALNRGAVHSPILSATTRSWSPLALAAAESGDGTTAFAAVEHMSAPGAAELLEDALDQWAVGGASPDEIAGMIKVIGPQDLGMEPEETVGAFDAPSPVVMVPNAPGGTGKSTTGWPGGDYTLHLGVVEMPDGRPLPLLALEPRTERAGLEDLRRRCQWRPWNGRGSAFPELDFNWRLRAGIAAQSLEEFCHTDAEGFDDVELWRGAAKVPDEWWELLDVAQHALVCGPVGSADPDAIAAAAAAGELVAVVARVRFA